MFDHVGLPVSDFAKSLSFYRAALEPLDPERHGAARHQDGQARAPARDGGDVVAKRRESFAIQRGSAGLPAPARQDRRADLDHRPAGLGELCSGALRHRKRICAPVR